MDGRDFLDTAEALAEDYLSEPFWRSAISRAYYAAFLDARTLLRDDMGFTVRPENTHQDVQDLFKKSNQSTGKKISNLLERLHKHRKRADYDIEDSVRVSLMDVEARIAEARKIISHVDGCLNDDALYNAIKTNIDAWIQGRPKR